MLEAQPQTASAYATIQNPIEKRQAIRSQANQRYTQEPDWVTFYREILGINGIIRRNYPDAQALSDFEKTEEYSEIQQILAKLPGALIAWPGHDYDPRKSTTIAEEKQTGLLRPMCAAVWCRRMGL